IGHFFVARRLIRRVRPSQNTPSARMPIKKARGSMSDVHRKHGIGFVLALAPTHPPAVQAILQLGLERPGLDLRAMHQAEAQQLSLSVPPADSRLRILRGHSLFEQILPPEEHSPLPRA